MISFCIKKKDTFWTVTTYKQEPILSLADHYILSKIIKLMIKTYKGLTSRENRITIDVRFMASVGLGVSMANTNYMPLSKCDLKHLCVRR